MKSDLKKISALVLFLFSLMSLSAVERLESRKAASKPGCISGIVMDKEFNETLPGAAIQIVGSSDGTITDIDGNFEIANLNPGKYTLRFTYISYEPKEVAEVSVESGKITRINIEMGKANLQLNEVVVTGRRNNEGEGALLLERKLSTVAVESMGAKEMSIKGISNVEDGVKKITGISTSGNNQVFVRGLGDRYSITTLNGLTIASPNPDHKLIPLSLFSSSLVKNIKVSKVYNPNAFGDYAGAHIDIETKENSKNSYLTLGVSTGGKAGTLLKPFYKADQPCNYFGFNRSMNLSQQVKDMSSKDFATLRKSPFSESFSATKGTALPEIGLSLNGGKSFMFGENELSISVNAQFDNEYTNYTNTLQSTMTAQGEILDAFTSDKWSYETTTSALGQISFSLKDRNRFSYNILYVNKSEDNFATREGFDAEGMPLLANNSLYRNYQLLNNQLIGVHELARKWNIDWKGAYGHTKSDEPDRRQIMYLKNENGGYDLFKLNQQETSRFFANLSEKEWTGNVSLTYLPSGRSNAANKVRLGGAYKNKSRDFESSNYYYNLKDINPEITDIYHPDFINDANIANGSVSIKKVALPRNNYYANNWVAAVFMDFGYKVIESLLLSGGLRYESSLQSVRYWTDAGKEQKAELKSNDLFPALNIKYSLDQKQNFLFSASRTITRPSFIEMAPFEYKESYGGAAVRGYADLKNGINYNLDLRYEFYPAPGDLISISGYYKYLDSPIERVQEYAGAAINTFRNVDKGQVAGFEAEYRKNILRNLRFGVNASYIYTVIQLPENGIYTDKKRQLQGASPYLINADINWSPLQDNERNLSLALVYNVRGPRISSVGINGVGNVKEEAFHSLDFNGIMQFNSKMQMKLSFKNLLNQANRFKQEVANTGEEKLVERYRKGTSFSVGFNYTF